MRDDAPVELGVDNTGARDLAHNPEHHQRSKHIQRRHYFIRELVEEGRLTVPFVPTDKNIADFFTKALKPPQFIHFRDIIMNVPAQLDLMSDSAHSGSARVSETPARSPASAARVRGGVSDEGRTRGIRVGLESDLCDALACTLA